MRDEEDEDVDDEGWVLQPGEGNTHKQHRKRQLTNIYKYKH